MTYDTKKSIRDYLKSYHINVTERRGVILANFGNISIPIRSYKDAGAVIRERETWHNVTK